MKEKTNGIETYVNYATVEQLNNEAKTRAHNDKVIAGVVNNLSSDYDENNEKNIILLNKKQDKIAEELATKNKNIVEAINEMNSKLDTDFNKFSVVHTELINSLKKVETLLTASVYTKFREIAIDADSYLFEEYDENYWHMFILEFQSDNKKVSGILETPSQLSPEVSSCNLTINYAATTSFNLIFSPSEKKLEIKKWNQQNQKINKVTIYRKQILN